jgi:hypothetical protein
MMVTIAFSLAGAIRAGFKARDSAENAVEPSRTAELAVEVMRSDIESAAPPRGILAGLFTGSPSTDEKGESDYLSFYSTAPGPNHDYGSGELRQIELMAYTDPTSGEHLLVRRVTTNLLSEVQQVPDDEVLCRNVGQFMLEYFDGTDWVNTWDSSQYDNTLPSAVRMTLELERPAGLSGQNQVLRFIRIFQPAGYNPPGTWLSDAPTTTGTTGTAGGTGTTGGTGTSGAGR